MDSRGRAVAAVALVVLVVAAVAIFIDTNGDVASPGLEERYLAVEDYTGRMIVNTTVRGPTENTTFYVENDEGAFVANGSLLPEEPRFRGAPRVVEENASVTVREFRPLANATGDENRTIRAVTRRGRGTVANRTVVADVRYRRPDRYRYDYVRPPEPDLVTLLIDGANATRYERGGEVIATSTDLLGVETIGIRFADVLVDVSERYEISADGTERVAGVEARVLELTPTTEMDRPVDRLWIDPDTELPIRIRANRTIGDRTVETTVTYRDMSYDTGLAEDTFDVDVQELPPAPAEGPGGDGSAAERHVTYRDYDTLDGARNAVSFALTPPTRLAGLAFTGATVRIDGGNESARLRYRNETANATFLQSRGETPRSRGFGPGDENVTVGGVDGEAATFGGGVNAVRWRCGEDVFELSGELDRATLLRIADSVPCDAA